MAALDDIKDGGGFSAMQRPLQVSPPAVDASLQGAPNSVGSRVALQPPKAEQPASAPQPRAQEQAPGTDASALVGKPGTGTDDEEAAFQKEQDEAVMGIDQQIAALNAAKEASRAPETEKDRRKRERQEKSRKIIAATVDGLSALSNLFFTSQYAPSSYNAQSSQLGKVNERIAALKAEREAEADRYNNLMIKIGDAQNARAKTLRDLRAQHEAQKLAREKAQRDAEEHGWLAALQPDKQREQKGKADRAGYEAITAKAKADNAPAMQKAELETEQARRGSYIASANASNASAKNSLASAAATKQKMGQEKAEKPYAYDRHGNKFHFEKESTAEKFARDQGTWQEYEVRKKTSVTEAGDTEAKVTETVEKRGYSQKPQKPSPTAGGGGGKKSPTS